MGGKGGVGGVTLDMLRLRNDNSLLFCLYDICIIIKRCGMIVIKIAKGNEEYVWSVVRTVEL